MSQVDVSLRKIGGVPEQKATRCYDGLRNAQNGGLWTIKKSGGRADVRRTNHNFQIKSAKRWRAFDQDWLQLQRSFVVLRR
jgi:hypothetical protein